MDKIITIDGKQVGFRATARTPRLYRGYFQRDVVRDLNELVKAFNRAVKAKTEGETDAEAQLSVMNLEAFENIAYTMARQYDPSIPADPGEWLDGFTTFGIYAILPQILELWMANQKTTSTAKNA